MSKLSKLCLVLLHRQLLHTYGEPLRDSLRFDVRLHMHANGVIAFHANILPCFWYRRLSTDSAVARISNVKAAKKDVTSKLFIARMMSETPERVAVNQPPAMDLSGLRKEASRQVDQKRERERERKREREKRLPCPLFTTIPF